MSRRAELHERFVEASSLSGPVGLEAVKRWRRLVGAPMKSAEPVPLAFEPWLGWWLTFHPIVCAEGGTAELRYTGDASPPAPGTPAHVLLDVTSGGWLIHGLDDTDPPEPDVEAELRLENLPAEIGDKAAVAAGELQRVFLAVFCAADPSDARNGPSALR